MCQEYLWEGSEFCSGVLLYQFPILVFNNAQLGKDRLKNKLFQRPSYLGEVEMQPPSQASINEERKRKKCEASGDEACCLYKTIPFGECLTIYMLFTTD